MSTPILASAHAVLSRSSIGSISPRACRGPWLRSRIWPTAQTCRSSASEPFLGALLAERELAQKPSLWRPAAAIAEQREQPARQLECLEQALALEYRNLPEVINLEDVRRDYRTLLGRYQSLAEAMATLKLPPPPDFAAKVVRTADRWRALDSNSTDACQSAARILQVLGQRELGWDYLTTPIGQRPAEAEPGVELARTLNRQGEPGLADRAYAAAFEAEPTNAQILWDRAAALKQAGRLVEAQKLFRQLAECDWQPRFQGLQSQARWQLGP
jgi:tetratricopeptide (TPR) repeat protein